MMIIISITDKLIIFQFQYNKEKRINTILKGHRGHGTFITNNYEGSSSGNNMSF